MTVVQSKVLDVENQPVEGLTVRVFLYAASDWLDDGSATVTIQGSTVTDSLGEWSIDLIPSSEYDAIDSYYGFLIPGVDIEFAVVPDIGPVELFDILIDPEDMTPADPPTLPLYLLRSERGSVDGVAPLDAGGKVPVANLPAGAGGDLEDYYTSVETDTLLAGKAAQAHSHAISDVTGLPTALDDLISPTELSDAVTDALVDAPRYVSFNAGWPARGGSPRATFFIGGSEATDEPADAVAGDVWIPSEA